MFFVFKFSFPLTGTVFFLPLECLIMDLTWVIIWWRILRYQPWTWHNSTLILERLLRCFISSADIITVSVRKEETVSVRKEETLSENRIPCFMFYSFSHNYTLEEMKREWRKGNELSKPSSNHARFSFVHFSLILLEKA